MSFSNLNSFSWHMKYVGLPLALGVTIFILCSFICFRKRRAALQKKVVVITGASSGIGEALAHAFYEQGSKVVLAARRIKELDRVKNDLMSRKLDIKTEEPIILELDLADFNQMDKFIKNVINSCGHIDILINNGGVSHRASILQTDIKVYKQIMDVNYFGTIALTKAALPKMIERKSGHIVFISSVQGLISIPDRSAYAGTKHALQAFADALRAEMHQHKISVSIISPGYVQTAVSLNALTGTGEKHGIMDKATAEGFTATYAAEQFLNMIVNKEKEAILSQFIPRLAIFLRHSLPSLYFLAITKRANKTQ